MNSIYFLSSWSAGVNHYNDFHHVSIIRPLSRRRTCDSLPAYQGLSCRHGQQAGDTLHLAVKQYIPLDNLDPQPGDVTIIGTQANGYPKASSSPSIV